MKKRITSSIIAAALLVSPVIVSAQSTTDDPALIAQLTALIQILTQELQQLLATHGTHQYTGIKGSSTLTATCQGHPYTDGANGISWGSYPVGGTGSYTYRWTLANDVTSPAGSDFSNLYQQNTLQNYGSAGQKSAQVTISDGVTTVTTGCSIGIGTGTSVSSASIDSSSQKQTTSSFTITGFASGAAANDGVIVYLVPVGDTPYANNFPLIAGQFGKDGIYVNNGGGMKSGGQWTAQFPYVNNGSYAILVYEAQTKALLAQATLSVSVAGASVPNPVLSFVVSPAAIPQGSATTLSWTAAYTGLCTITNLSTGAILDLSRSNDNRTSAYSNVSTGPLSQTTVFELRCAPLMGATGGYAVKDVTVAVAQGQNLLPSITTITATIDQNSLNSSSILPTLSGTAINTNSISVVVRDAGGAVVASSKQISVANGRWFVPMGNTNTNVTANQYWWIAYPLNSGSYTVSVYDQNNTVLTTGTLVINAGTNPSVSLTVNGMPSTSITNGSSVLLAWNATNASSCTLWTRVLPTISSSCINCTGAAAPLSMGTVNTSGTLSIAPTRNTEFSISCTSPSAGSVGGYVDVTVNN